MAKAISSKMDAPLKVWRLLDESIGSEGKEEA
jgi:hypothetical protein